MGVRPTHRSLDREMATVEPQCCRHFDAAQYNAFDIIERDVEASDCVGGHATALWMSVMAGANEQVGKPRLQFATIEARGPITHDSGKRL